MHDHDEAHGAGCPDCLGSAAAATPPTGTCGCGGPTSAAHPVETDESTRTAHEMARPIAPPMARPMAQPIAQPIAQPSAQLTTPLSSGPPAGLGPGGSGGGLQPPRWATTVSRPQPRGRASRLAAGALALVLLSVLATTFLGRVLGGPSESLVLASTAAQDTAATNAANDANGPPRGVVDLRAGSVFLQSNDALANEVVAFGRDSRGRLTEVGRFPTGGAGSGSFEDSAQGIVLGTEEGETSPTQIVDDARLLFVVNAGTADITVFRVDADRLERLSVTPTGGARPVSLTVRNGMLYVLNSGEVDRRLFLGGGAALENCAHGGKPSITGFRVSAEGVLTPIPDSTRSLSEQAESGCAQVSFSPDGETLVVTERVASVDEGTVGALVSYDVEDDGTLGDKTVSAPTGNGPFGFTFTPQGLLLSTEQNGGYANPGGGGAAVYDVDGGQLSPLGETVGNNQTDTCWIVVTHDQRFAFTSSPFEGGAISTYSLSSGGALTLAHPSATAKDGVDVIDNVVTNGVTDLALSQDSRFLYQLNSFEGLLYSFRVESDGRLTHLGTEKVFDLAVFGAGGQGAPFGIAAR
ncbi:lactonase family protein [Nocardioides plantarum]|uniref:Lactonase family protein n=1 Tax=Nocardioides plantarum TaxID=29299 RepID=A0ABV5KBL7_9ACTN|nr:lactonase family protein [Nocardioides plantarum]